MIMVLAIAFVISWLMTPVCIKLAPKIGAVDIPKDERRMHTRPIPRFGGLAIYLGTVVAILIAAPHTMKVMGIVLGGTFIYAVGLYDDLKNMSAKVKLLCQIISGLIVFATGTKIAYIHIPFHDQSSYIFLSPVLMCLLTVLWVVGFTNTINLIDGLDGLAAGITLIASLCVAYSAVLTGHPETAILMLAIAGGALGFLPYNFNPAKIFMGDAGSQFLGFMVASVSLETMKSTTIIILLIPLIALGIPIFDTTFAIIRRKKANRPIMEADKGHLHHRIMAWGMGQKRTVILLYAISGILGICAIQLGQRNYIASFIMLLIAAAFIYVIATSEKTPAETEVFLRYGNFDGLNVTIPYKKTAAALCDIQSQTARKLGSVNTIAVRKDEEGRRVLYGANTDYDIDPEECMADNFKYAMYYGIDGKDGQGYANPEIIQGIIDIVSD